MKIYLLALVFILYGCERNASDNVDRHHFDCEDEGFVDVNKWRGEVLEVDSMIIDNDFPLITSIESYINKFGKEINKYPVLEDIPLFGNEDDQITRYVFNGMIIDRRTDESIISSIDFRENEVIISHPRIVLKNDLPVSEVCALFPRSCRLISMGGNQWSGFIELKTSNASFDSRRIFLIFQREKLIKMKIVNFDFT